MSEKIKVRFTVPETTAESANRFLKSLAYPTQEPGGELSPPLPISVERESGGELGHYFIESLIFRPTSGVDAEGPRSAIVIEVVALPVKSKYLYTGPRGEDERIPCQKCGGSGIGETFAGVPSYCKKCDGTGRVTA